MDSKTAEFASLFALFEDIATRRSRMTDDDDDDDDRQVLADAIPKDLESIVRNLASLVDTHPQVQGRSRRNTVTTGSEGKFPLGARYPFTFKMMLHKLYELEDWGKKVKDVLERSQNEFKPLSETPEKLKDKERKVALPIVSPEPRVRFEKDAVVGRLRRGSVATTTTTTTTRPRSHTVGAIGRPKDLVTMREKPEKSKEKDRETPDDVRIIKKRCVGRRQPSEALTDESSVRKRHWVYDAAVSSFEVNERRRSVESITPIPEDKDLQDAGSAKTPGTRRRAASMYVGAGEGASAGRKRRAMSIAHVTSPRGIFDGGKTVPLAA
ncbi:uncharacterized protein EV420DRAFT_1271296 [Desarmillaria tabescens]|uniref:Uncharacterized protein n=1 Tax=Armillaria tabescens TaxID=1929756 RepID=A0AA39KBD5_ARMTA|nr:uncharacterized protein EV420DRAFT_1271296 [Desarmillaria tabescens]KAK0457872.1 hypothetical protein EV420DRAFT_1271296 [Desarmillaria tabescens]